MHLWDQYLRPSSVSEALAALRNSSDSVAVVAGGTDLLLDLEQGRHAPVTTLVDVTAVSEMVEIRADDGWVHIGAAAPLRAVIQHETVRHNAPALVEACELIGGPQVRNVATLGGNVAHALPAGDGTIALLALGAEALLANAAGSDWRPVEELFAGPGKPTFDRSSDLLVSFRFPLRRAGEGSAFRRVMRPQGVAIAILNMAARLLCNSEGEIEQASVSVGPAGPRPLRARGTERALVGSKPDDNSIRRALEALVDEVSLRTSPHRSTAEYRGQLLPSLLRQTVQAAAGRALAQERAQ